MSRHDLIMRSFYAIVQNTHKNAVGHVRLKLFICSHR